MNQDKPDPDGNGNRKTRKGGKLKAPAVILAGETGGAGNLQLSRKKFTGQRCLGPVGDLEHHLPSDWWRTLFNALYLKTDGDVVENPENTRQEIDTVTKIAGLSTTDSILDYCCGQGRHALELARRGFHNVTGVDRSRYLIRLARKRAKSEGLGVHFYEGDARKYKRYAKAFDCVMCLGNSFGYFEQKSDDETVLKNIFNLMGPGGVFVLDVVDGEWMRTNFERRSWEWIDENHFVCRERDISKDGQRIVTREVITHAEKGVIADQFYAERLYTKDELLTLCEKTGFETARFYDPIQTVSTRGQDLGMLAHRHLLTAKMPEKRLFISTSAVPFPKVAVIMGDPLLPDRVKKDGMFGAADFDTIGRMKESLSKMKEYEFSFLDNHQTLLHTLATERPEFIFNLCDEGYKNDAFMELHVPAFLEMLKIPYTGAGPSCLGLCYNKSLVNAIAMTLDIPVPMETYLGPDDTVATLPSTFPALVKPNFGDSSMGITKDSVVYNGTELISYVNWLRENYGRIPILIQEFLTGPEYSIGIIGNPGLTYKVLPPLEVDYSKLDEGLTHILGYESKWIPDSPWWTQISYKECKTDEDNMRKLIDYSNVLFERLRCRDYARFDFRADSSGTVKLLEVNPNPGWCWDGKMNLMAGFDGMSYSDLLGMIIRVAQERILAYGK